MLAFRWERRLCHILIKDREASGFEDRVPNVAFLHQVNNLGSDDRPDQVEWHVERSFSYFDRDLEESSPRGDNQKGV